MGISVPKGKHMTIKCEYVVELPDADTFDFALLDELSNGVVNAPLCDTTVYVKLGGSRIIVLVGASSFKNMSANLQKPVSVLTSELGADNRITQVLEQFNCQTLADVVLLDRATFLDAHGVGPVAVERLMTLLASHQLSLSYSRPYEMLRYQGDVYPWVHSR